MAMKLKKPAWIFCGVLLVAAAAVGSVTIATDHTHGVSSSDVIEHSGGLDQCGGHWNHKTGTYHYHRTPRC
jgi:hypothetical protein